MTLPTADGSVGQFLQTNGSGTLSFANGLNYATGSILSAAFKDAVANPVLILPAPGAGKMYMVSRFIMFMDFNTTGYTGGGM